MTAVAAAAVVLSPVSGRLCQRRLQNPTSSLQLRLFSVREASCSSTLEIRNLRRSCGITAVTPAAASRDASRPAAAGRAGGATAAPADKASRPKSIPELIEFLYDDLPHLFDAQGIDPGAYDEKVRFRDPITSHDGIARYLFNISLLKSLFSPEFYLHGVKQTGPLEVTTRWTMVMRFALLPWKPEVVFTGRSLMGINPNNMKFNSHVDLWDSIENNDYFSVEGVIDLVKQLRYYKTPNLDTPKYTPLKRTPNYEIRHYHPFLVAETTSGSDLSGSAGFNRVTGYIFGKNTGEEKIPMTTPVFTQANSTITADDASGSDQLNNSPVAIQVVLPSDRALGELPDPVVEGVQLREVKGGYAAAVRFSGKPTEDVVREKEKELRDVLVRDGLRPRRGCALARYNDPGRTPEYIMRNEVLIWLDGFTLDD